jgi:hypothetical protein
MIFIEFSEKVTVGKCMKVTIIECPKKIGRNQFIYNFYPNQISSFKISLLRIIADSGYLSRPYRLISYVIARSSSTMHASNRRPVTFWGRHNSFLASVRPATDDQTLNLARGEEERSSPRNRYMHMAVNSILCRLILSNGIESPSPLSCPHRPSFPQNNENRSTSSSPMRPSGCIPAP